MSSANRLIVVAHTKRGDKIRIISARAAVLDATSEFLNVVGGNLAAAAARIGKKLELTAPKHGELPPPGPTQHMLIATLGAPEGEVEFVVVTEKP